MPLSLLPRIHVGGPIHRGALTLFPLWTEHVETPTFYVPADTLPGSVTIGELPEPTVPELVVDNKAAQAVLVLEGEMIAGGLQHRALNVSALLPAGEATVVPVSCVEQGRWGTADTSRWAGRHSTPSVRRRKTASVAAALRTGAGRRSDQSGVWDEVAEQASRSGVVSPTGSLMDLEVAAQPVIDEVTRDLHPLPGQRGVVVGIGGEVRALELFDSAAVFEHYFRRIIDGFASEALTAPATATAASAARRFIRALQRLDAHESPALGLGTDFSADGEDLAALGLRLDGRPIHLTAFAM